MTAVVIAVVIALVALAAASWIESRMRTGEDYLADVARREEARRALRRAYDTPDNRRSVDRVRRRLFLHQAERWHGYPTEEDEHA